MNSLKARVCNGRLALDEPADLPEGTEVELTVADDGDELDAEERAALHSALEEAWASVCAGEMQPMTELSREFEKSE